MNNIQYFQQQGFSVIHHEKTENKLLQFLQQHYPQTIVGNELKIEELKAILGIPFDEKTNGYGLNFVGRNVARAKYAQPTKKALRLNTALSKDMDTTQNLVLKGDNLDSLKILKNHYSGKIKCIYIDPPYNTQSDEFIYPDKFDREEAEVLGIAENLSEEDFARMDFSFKTKKSHNGWLAFMYPRLLLARDLLSTDGVIFISIDDNEQANLKILCDEIFGEENFVSNTTVIVKTEGRRYGAFAKTHENILIYSKNYELFKEIAKEIEVEGKKFSYEDEIGGFNLQELRNQNTRAFNSSNRPNLYYPFYIDLSITDKNGFYKVSVNKEDDSWKEVYAIEVNGLKSVWRWGKEKSKQNQETELVARKGSDNIIRIYQKYRKLTETPKTVWFDKKYISNKGTKEVQELLGIGIFDFPKPIELIKTCLSISTNENAIILDFFAGSGTTAHAVMQLNAEDGGNRKFILCQIDEPIAENKPAYKFCQENGLPPVISSITIERVKRAGELITQNANLFNEKIDTGYKVFDSVASPQLSIENENILFPELETDALSRIYNMIFSVGTDAPSQTPQVVQPDSVYRIGNNYYITNSERVSKEDFAQYLSPENRVFVDGWTASLNATLQHYKDEVKIVF